MQHKLSGHPTRKLLCSSHSRRTPRREAVVALAFKPETSSTWNTTVAGYDLTKEEAASLSKIAPVGTQTISLPLLQDILRNGLQKKHGDLQELEGAILATEQISLGALSPSGSKPRPEPARGTAMWQPVFASSGGFPRLLYIPVPEYFDLTQSDASQSIDIITELGPITTHFLGECSWLNDTEFSYSIKQIKIDVGTWSGTFGMPAKLDNVLSFFYVDGELACARSKLGGTMLLVADPEGSKKYIK
jgi:hypothetical protein